MALSLTRPLLRIASLQGRVVLESLVTGQFTTLQGGKVMTSATATNKSFSFTIPAGLDAGSLMIEADKALAWLDSHTSDDLTNYLKSRPTKSVYVRF